VENTNRPYLYEWYTNARGVTVKPLSISAEYVVCNGERIFTREFFSSEFMVYTDPSVGVYNGRITKPNCEGCE
jgi:hypothetical protein